MKGKVLLSEFVNACKKSSRIVSAYLNTTTGKIVIVGVDDIFIENPDEKELKNKAKFTEKELIENEEYIKMPDQHFLNEYVMMECFSMYYPNEKVSSDLLQQIKGRGAFRRFYDSIKFYSIEHKWEKYRDEEYIYLSKRWLEKRDIEFVDDSQTD